MKFLIELETTPDCRDPIKNLRALLKLAKRWLGFRCVGAVELDGGKPRVTVQGGYQAPDGPKPVAPATGSGVVRG